MKGQWLGRFESSTPNAKAVGNLLIDIDELDDAYIGYAVVQNDQANLPIVFTRFITNDKSDKHQLSLNLFCLDPRNFDPTEWENIQNLFPGIVFAKNADVTLRYEKGLLNIQWHASQTDTTGSASIKPSQAGAHSVLKATKLNSWSQFKAIVQDLPPHQYVFRGQQSNIWRLRTSFHRTGRASLERYSLQDIAAVSKHLSGLTKHLFDLKDPLQYGAFVSLIQHHGYPTPLLDWTHSPFVAAFFAYRGLSAQKNDQFVRIFKFDIKSWSRLPQLVRLGILPPHVSLLDAYAIENSRMLPQQALSTITNVDDIESYIQQQEAMRKTTFLEAIDIPVSERHIVSRELALMGIGAGSLLPGLDGACEQLRERFFPA
jgi:hypothetical protein